MRISAEGKSDWDDYAPLGARLPNGRKVTRRRSGWAASARGWLFRDRLCRGNYLDYGPEHYRSPHEYCRADCRCRDSQPGNVHAMRCPSGTNNGDAEVRYFETVLDARSWIETGVAP